MGETFTSLDLVLQIVKRVDGIHEPAGVKTKQRQ
jgi:hypothetical protein